MCGELRARAENLNDDKMRNGYGEIKGGGGCKRWILRKCEDSQLNTKATDHERDRRR